jgi:hypothetical protein
VATLYKALLNELEAWAAALRCWQLYALLLALLGGMLLIAQAPLRYMIDVGVGEGYGGDLPLLRGFNDAESDEHGSYRWTADGAQLRLPGVGARPLLVELSFFPIGPRVAEIGPQTIEIWSRGQLLAALPVRREGAHYRLPVSARLMAGGNLELTLRTATFAPGGDDPRRLGTPLNRVIVTALNTSEPAQPNWSIVGAWLLAGLLAWALVLRAGFQAHAAMLLVGAGVALVLLAALLDPPRFAFGARAALTTAALCYGLLLTLRVVLPRIMASAGTEASPYVGGRTIDVRALRWLLLIIVLAFGLRYGGRLYPDSMGGDIGFHYNRMTEVIKGRVLLLSRNRGVDFPYPPGPYVALAPFVLLGLDTRVVLQLGAALVEGLSAALVFAIVAAAFSPQRHGGAENKSVVNTALLAAAIYVFTAAGFMTTWWSFDTHIYTQFAALLLFTCVILDWGVAVPIQNPKSKIQNSLLVLPFLLTCVFLGHFGFFINTALLGGLLLALVWLLAWRGAEWARRARWPLALAYGGALLAALLFFYSAYAPLFLAQAQAAAAGGLTGLAQRAPVPRRVLWEVLWQAGFVVHFGFFPLALAPVGLLILGRRARGAGNCRLLFALIGGSFLVSSLFMLLPFITQSTQSTRWLMFSAWGVAITGAVAARALWRSGRAGRLAVLLMAAFVLWNSATLWLGAMAWRIRPPEPF